MSKTAQMRRARKDALRFLATIAEDASSHADALDHKRKYPEIRNVHDYCLVHALLGVAAKARFAVHTAAAVAESKAAAPERK